jgi:hypothetical protein
VLAGFDHSIEDITTLSIVVIINIINITRCVAALYEQTMNPQENGQCAKSVERLFHGLWLYPGTGKDGASGGQRLGHD